MKKRTFLMKLMSLGLPVAVMAAMEGRSIFFAIGEPKLPSKFE